MQADAAPGTAPPEHTQRRIFKNLVGVPTAGPPAGAFRPRGSYLGSALGAVAFPGGASRRDEAGGGREKAPDRDHALPLPPRASKRRSAPGWRAAISRASTAPVSRWARPPRPPPPVKSGAARPLTRSPPKPAARRACPLPLLAASENARARPRRGRSWLHSPGLGGSRAAEYLVDPSAAGEPGGGAEWVGVEREKRGQGAGLSYQDHQSRARVPSYGQVSRSALAGPTSSWETREGEQSMWKGSPPGKVNAPGHGSAQLQRPRTWSTTPGHKARRAQRPFVFLLTVLPPISPLLSLCAFLFNPCHQLVAPEGLHAVLSSSQQAQTRFASLP